MSLCDYVVSQGLTDFKPERIDVVWPDFFKPVNNVVQWDDICNLTKDQISLIQEAIDHRHITKKENTAHNARIYTKFRLEFAELMQEYGINVWKRKDDDKMYATYESMFTDIKTKNNMTTYYVSNELSMSVVCNGVKFHESASQVQNWYDRVSQKVKEIETKSNNERKLLIDAISYCVENGLSVRGYKSDKAIIDMVDEYSRRLAIEEAYPAFTPIEHVVRNDKCSADCVLEHGQQYCSCGRCSITYRVTGDTLKHYSVALWVRPEPVLGKNIFYHPYVGEHIPF